MKKEHMQKLIRKLLRIGLAVIALGYFAVLLRIVLFKYGFATNVGGVNLRPFASARMFFDGTPFSVAVKNVVGNYAIFLPLGILLAYWMPGKKGLAVILCAVVSMLFETIQLLTGCGIADVDDLILNTAGGASGVLFFHVMLQRLDNKVKVPVASLTFLCMFGICGIISLRMLAPSMLPARVEIYNQEILQGMDKENYDIETLALQVAENKLITTTKSEVIYIPQGKQSRASQDGAYIMTKDCNLVLEQYDYTYSPNGNIMKTTVSYSNVSSEELERLLEEKSRRVSLFLNPEGECKCAIIVKRT